jgi:hypothetical protein
MHLKESEITEVIKTVVPVDQRIHFKNNLNKWRSENGGKHLVLKNNI